MILNVIPRVGWMAIIDPNAAQNRDEILFCWGVKEFNNSFIQVQDTPILIFLCVCVFVIHQMVSGEKF